MSALRSPTLLDALLSAAGSALVSAVLVAAAVLPAQAAVAATFGF
jgi:hypothetical protein